ncbi:MAG: phage terminase large subunit, partial [Nitratireductor sp.]
GAKPLQQTEFQTEPSRCSRRVASTLRRIKGSVTVQGETSSNPSDSTRDRDISLSDKMVWNRKPGEVLLPDHMDEAAFEAKRREIGSRAFEAQYQQSPTPAGGSIIRPVWFGTTPANLRRDDYEAIVQSWDTASVPGESNDYSVCTTWGLKGNYIDLLDVYRGQHLYPELLQAAIKLRQTWAPHLIVVETQDVGRSLYADLMRQNHRGVRGFSPRDDKVQRMSSQSVKLERREGRLPLNAPWKEAFLAEAAAFPNGKYDDQVDTMSQLLRTLDRAPGELRHCSRFKG